MKAIDLFAGIGGWSLGLELAGIEVVKAYEIWPRAIDIYRRNLGTAITNQDVSLLTAKALPDGIDLVVGSPPCTQFSYANRGGSGNLSVGIAGVAAFLEVVKIVQPKYWVLENVPRLAAILSSPDTRRVLKSYERQLDDAETAVVDFSNFGLPQRRRRLLLGNIGITDLVKATAGQREKTLGEVIDSIGSNSDPFYDQKIEQDWSDNNKLQLTEEESRYNWELKRNHVVYNDMAFPDSLNRPARTITATCTAISRESVVISSDKGGYRRLSTSERASIQSFPVNYDFGSYSEGTRFKALGNAMPPLVAYACARHILGKQFDATTRFPSFKPAVVKDLTPPPPTRRGAVAPVNLDRRFRFALKGLRFKSGMRFELNNMGGPEAWRVQFFFGPPGAQECVDFHDMLDLRIEEVSPRIARTLEAEIEATASQFAVLNHDELQTSWSGRGDKAMRVFKYLDDLSALAASKRLQNDLSDLSPCFLGSAISELLFSIHGFPRKNESKLEKLAPQIFSGFLPMIIHNSRVSRANAGIAA